MPYTSKAVANYFLDLAENNGKTVDPLQIQKLVYFSQGWHLALTDRSLIKEIIQAWPYGPVIPALFHEFKRWGNAPIRERASDFALVDRKPTGGIVFGKRVYSLDAEATDDEHLVV